MIVISDQKFGSRTGTR